MMAETDVLVEKAQRAMRVVFEGGLVGCEDWRHFLLLETEEAGPIKLLHCEDEPQVEFFVTDPYLIDEDYEIEMPEAAAKSIGLESWQDAMVLCTLLIQQEPLLVLANLLGPLVINRRNGRGVQIVLSGSKYSARHLVASDASGAGEC